MMIFGRCFFAWASTSLKSIRSVVLSTP